MLSSDLDLLSHSHVECAQFIGPVSTNRHASHSIAKSFLIGVQFLFYVILLMVTPSYCFPELLRLITFFSSVFCCPLCHSLHQVHVYFRLLFPGSPTSASSYCRSGERGSQSGENALVGVCVSWWKPSSHSPLDQGKSFAPSVKEALWHSVTMTKWAILVEELVSGFCTSSTAPYGAATVFKHVTVFTCSPSVSQNGEVLSTTWEEDVVAQRSISVLHLKITPTDNQAVLSCESVNLVSLSPLSVNRKITVLCEWK